MIESIAGRYHGQHDVRGPVRIVIDGLTRRLEFLRQSNVVFARIGIEQVVWVIAAGDFDADAMPASEEVAGRPPKVDRFLSDYW